MSGIHGSEVEQLDSRSGISELGGIVGGRSELLQDLSADAGGWLLSLHHGAVPKVALYEEHHLVVLHQHFVAADVVEPSLHQELDSSLILVGACSCRGQGRRDGRDERFGVGGYQVLGELNKLGV